MPTTIIYKGATIAELQAGSIGTLSCNGKEMESDIVVVAPESEGGGTSADERVLYVTFMNGATELISYPVIVGDTVKEPVAAGLIDTPTKEQTVSIQYTFSGWSLTDGGSADSSALTDVTEDRTVYVAFAASARLYTVNFYDGETLLQTSQVGYGSEATPPDTFKEGYNFVAWEPSDLTITGDTDFYGTWELDQGWLVALAAPSLTTQGLLPVYSPDGTRLFVKAGSYTVAMYDTTTSPYTLLTSVTPKSSTYVRRIAISPDGTWLAVVFDNNSSYIKNSLYVYSIGESSLTRQSAVIGSSLKFGDDSSHYCSDVEFSPDGTKLFAYSYGEIHIFTIGGTATEWAHSTYAYPRNTAKSFSVFSPDGSRLASQVTLSYYYRGAYLLDVTNGYADISDTYLGTDATSGAEQDQLGAPVAYSPDGRYLAFGNNCRSDNSAGYTSRNYQNLFVLDTSTTPYTTVMYRADNGESHSVTGVSFSADGSLMAVVMEASPYLLVYDTATWTLKETPMTPPTVGLRSCKFSSNNHLVLCSKESPYMYVYEVKE